MGDPDETYIEIRLTADEALVMSDWIFELQQSDQELSDEAVWMPLYRIGGALETTLAEIFSPDYGDRLDAARARLLAKLGHSEADGKDDAVADGG